MASTAPPLDTPPTVMTAPPPRRVLRHHWLVRLTHWTNALAIILLLPLPFVHMLPGAAMVCYGLGLATRDGLAVLVGHVLAVATFLILAAIALLAHGGLMSLFGSGT